MSVFGFDEFGHTHTDLDKINKKNAEEETETGFFSKVFKKPFMPTSWKWFRTSGASKVYRFNAPRGVITKLDFKIPSQFASYVVDSQGNSHQEGSNFSLNLEGDTGDYFTIGNRQSVFMNDVGGRFPKRVQVTFPTLAFREQGVNYSLDWNRFAQQRRLANGAFDEDWGYAREGKPTIGSASAYDSEIKLAWNRTIKWWWLLIGGGFAYGIYKYFKR